MFYKQLTIFLCLLFLGVGITNATVLIILVDLSSSSPIVDPQLEKRAEAIIRGEIMGLSLGDTVEVRTAGDDRATVFSLTQVVQRFRTPQGDTREALANTIPTAITQFIQKIARKQLQGESALTNAIYDANKLCGQACRTIFLTDGFQHTTDGLDYPRDFQKPLLPLPNMDLSHMSMRMIGVGGGLETHPEARIAIEQNWYKWLQDSQIKDVTIERF